MLVEHCLKGDKRAQKALYHQFYEELYQIGRRYLANHDDTEDALIQAFTKVFKNLEAYQYQGEGSLGKWVRTILINESLKLLKKRRVDEDREEEQLLQLAANSANAMEQMQAADLLLMVEQLPQGYRTVFNLFIIEGFSHKEIAAMLNISENTSKTQLLKARKALINTIKQEATYGN